MEFKLYWVHFESWVVLRCNGKERLRSRLLHSVGQGR